LSRPVFARDLLPSEKRFFAAMTDISFGRIEFLRIERGELVLDPWPTTVRTVKFGSADTANHKPLVGEVGLKAEVAEFFEYVRAVDAGEIRCLALRHSLPFTMEIAHGPNAIGGRRD
jgi:hypothetical protein